MNPLPLISTTIFEMKSDPGQVGDTYTHQEVHHGLSQLHPYKTKDLLS